MLSRALKITVLLLCLLLSLTACADNGGEDHTLLIYMCGSDLESSRGYASQNLEEILSANLPKNVNIVIQTGGSESWHNPNISSEHIGRYEVKNSKLTQLSSLQQENMGDGETLLSFLNFAKDSYPSDKTSLILWDHGGGTLGGVCFDENYGLDSLSLNELEYALDEANIDFEFIGFEAPSGDDGELINKLMGEWAYEQFAEIPRVGDSFRYHSLCITVSQMEHNRILKLSVCSAPENREGGEAE